MSRSKLPPADPIAFIREVQLMREYVPSFDEYPFNLPVIRGLSSLPLHPRVTFIIGENGMGKSTLLEAIAVRCGFNAEGGSRNFNFSTRESHSPLHSVLRVVRNTRRPSTGYFLRAESFYNVASEIDNLGVNYGYGDVSLHEQSHGESFMTLLTKRFSDDGLYILDEPEAALSPLRQMALVTRIHQLVREHCQFIIATHSPIVMAYPDAQILELTEDGILKKEFTETSHYSITREFMNNPEKMLAILMDEDETLPLEF